MLHVQDSPEDQDVLRDSQRHTGLRRRGRGRKRKENDKEGGERKGSRERETSSRSSSSSGDGHHPDESQIKLDTDRSFVLYPVGEIISCYEGHFRSLHISHAGDLRHREELQVKLNELITAVFRRHTKLNYFQVRR